MNLSFVKGEHTYGKNITRNGRTLVIYESLLVESYSKSTHVFAILGGFVYEDLQWYLIHNSIPFCLVARLGKNRVYGASLLKRPTNQFKPFQQSRQQVLEAYAPKGGLKSEDTGDFLHCQDNIPNHYPE
jgi:hypothetical protein